MDDNNLDYNTWTLCTTDFSPGSCRKYNGYSKYFYWRRGGYGVWVGEISINTTGIKSGTYNGKVIIERTNFTPLGIDLSVNLAKPTLPKWFVLLIVAILIIIAVYIISLSKDPKIGATVALLPVVLGILIIDAYSPFDSLGNILLKAAFLVPLAAYIVDVLKTRRDDRLTLEKSVTEVKKKAVEDAGQFFVDYLGEHGITKSRSCMSPTENIYIRIIYSPF
ncbi:MAG: hypothetical protein O8C64_08965 [Candidatus Methanoperedens sp.]|nr:hypothetical protein [Candidatus Methanoperedens sp.]